MRRRFIQRDGELIEVTNDYQSPRIDGPMVMGDIQPYRSMVDGREIGGRAQHREHMRTHNLVEIGNETKYVNSKPLAPPPGLKQTLIEAAFKHRKR